MELIPAAAGKLVIFPYLGTALECKLLNGETLSHKWLFGRKFWVHGSVH